MIGTHLGHYRLVHLLGEGGMGRVYAAEDTRLGRRVALKLLPEALCGVPEHAERFQREARLLAALNHPNVITVHSVEQWEGRPFITMELVEGDTLAQRIRPGGLPLDELLAIAQPLADALAAAHGHGIVHRDLKPANVMLGHDGRVKVVDFGIARPDRHLGGDQAQLTGAGLVLGTPAYMAPEQLKGEAIDPRVDVFALGVLLHELATGVHPFSGKSDADVISAILRDAPPSLRHHRPDLPGLLHELVSACLEKDPARRPASAAVVASRLAALRGAASAGDSGSRPASAAPAPRIAALAVLPLQELGGAADDLLADGLTEALIADLARTTGLKVISRNSTLRFRDSTEPLEDIARRLGVDALVTGSVRRSGNRIRVSVELIEAASACVLWADRYDRELEDVLRLQDDMAHAIADGVHARVREGDGERTAPLRRQVDPEVYMLDLKGRSQIELRTSGSFRAALPHFRRALARDPSYGPSWLGIVRACNMQANYGMVSPASVRADMEQALSNAREFGADPAEVLGEHAQMRWQFDFDWADADRNFQGALDLAPGNSRLWYWRGIVHATGGRFDDAFACLDRAESLDPLSYFMRGGRGLVLYFANRLPESIACLREVVELSPELAPTYWLLCMALSAAGEHEEAIHVGDIAVARMGRLHRSLAYQGHAYGRAGQAEAATRILAELQMDPADYVPPYFPAMVLLGLGRRDEALAELERGARDGDSMLRDMRVDRVWDALRGEPRFDALLGRMQSPADAAAATRVLPSG